MGIIISTKHSGFSKRKKSLLSIIGRKVKYSVFCYKNALVETKLFDLFEDGSIEVFRALRVLLYYYQSYTTILKPKIHFSPFFEFSCFDLCSYRAKSFYDGELVCY